MFAKSVPQQTVSIQTQESIADLISKLAKRNHSITESITEGQEEQPKVPKNRVASEVLMKMLGGE
ncbi:hypothetical protein L2520_06490 [Limosilactobacillus vaginalis]|uniref:Uncharacterized protein n=1 Tax=Limosilactobacillus vaginalis TaxID=1633 RepID=A0ABT4K843_9LACO|nr:hypothetical protein [Limosilactobacillus vaginalis]MCZ3747060.1 hypothetical protein [Limosilactobacillus vaginalis]MCZ3753752.1 hypothetical protein [Limosilactobacillus vaginalis]MCZ3755468.1 hypothetical protein [Limosilactobacillus vaginalis]MCZ3757187.1 hypothetical protein [Limosilactobacillus vaginalis]MCZ3769456.1 hypothetical protein [Limosilactobacillus vaginalis]